MGTSCTSPKKQVQKDQKHARSKYTNPKYARLETYYQVHKADINKKLIVAYEDALEYRCLDRGELNFNFISFQSEKIHNLLEILPFYSHITVLRLWKTSLGTEGARLLSPLLTDLHKLETLGLEDNHLQDEGATHISMGIQPLLHLKTLYLNCNSIGDSGIESISKALANNSEISCLALDENEIGPVGLNALMTGLTKSLGSIKILALSYNNFGDEGCERVLRDITSMTSLNKLLLKGNGVSEKMETALISAAHTAEIFN